MDPQAYDDNDAVSTSPEPELKRRKLRKGTRSCWDCKRRKVKCTFESVADEVCIACRRRGAPCVSQERPEEEAHPDDNRSQLFERVVRVEALLEELVKKVSPYLGPSAPSVNPKSGVYTPFSEVPIPSERVPPRTEERPVSDIQLPTPVSSAATPNIAIPEGRECTKLSQALLEAFPSQVDIDNLCKSDYQATFYFHQVITKEDNGPDHEAFDFVNELAKIPDPFTHPILVAKRMLIFAMFLQFFPPEQAIPLAEQAQVVTNRLADTAIRLVTTNEKMFGCMEALECIILEGVFQANCGNLRRAWLAFRRAMVAAQLMGMDRADPPPVKTIDPNTTTNPSFMWFRIVYMDRFFCLMLGLPQGSPDTSMNFDCPEATPSCKLENAHAAIAGRILDRNKRDPLFQDYSITQELDSELLKAAKSLPDCFWLPPRFATMQRYTRDAFWETMRLADQIHHYNLVHLLHLPYLLRCDSEPYHRYSKATCINASREILTRFVGFRAFNCITTCCRIGDFFALMAGMTILLAHIDSHRHQTENTLAHQRFVDRAMVEQVLEGYERVARETGDHFSSKSSDLLRRLLDVESETVQGQDHTAQTALCSLEQDSGVVQLPIPYFGIVRIAKEGIISKDWPAQQVSRLSGFKENPDSIHVANHIFSFGARQIPHQHSGVSTASCLPLIPDRQPGQSQVQAPLGGASKDDISRQQQALYPGLTAGLNDWAFQGVDTAFFDSVMRGSAAAGDLGSTWNTNLNGS